MKKVIYSLFILLNLIFIKTYAQTDSTDRIKFSGDLLLRIEQDWNSKNGLGEKRKDRLRARFNFRFGMTYKVNNWVKLGARIRTGYAEDQQGAPITLGRGTSEFDGIPITLDQFYFEGAHKNFTINIGKYPFPFFKQNDLFWNSNVIPEGTAIQYSAPIAVNSFRNFKITLAHYILRSENLFSKTDPYILAGQTSMTLLKNRLDFAPGFFYFHKIPDIADGKEHNYFSYAIAHLSTSFKISKKVPLKLMVDFYHNVLDYEEEWALLPILKEEKTGLVAGLKYGRNTVESPWSIGLIYAFIEKYAAVDYLADNNWARWTYSDYGSKASRLTNMKGVEFNVAYALDENLQIKLKAFFVEQIVNEMVFKETGNRVRLDLISKF